MATSITRSGDSGNQGDQIDLLNLVQLNSGHFVTPVRNTTTQRLTLVSWSATEEGAIIRLGDSGNQAGDTNVCASVAVANNRLVTAIRSVNSGRVKLISWQVSSDGTTISRIADSGTLAGAGDLIDVQRWGATPTTQPPVTLITTIRSSNSGRLKLIAWRLFGTGGFTRVGDSGNQAGAVGLIAAEADPDNGFFVTPVRASGDNRLKVIGWSVSSSPTEVTFDRQGDTGTQAGDVDALDSAIMNLNAVSASRTLLTAVRGVQSKRLKLIAWLVAHPGGEMTRKADSGQLAGSVDLVTANHSPDTGIVTAVKVHSNKRLRLIWWGVTGNNPETSEGVLEFQRIADSANQAGQIDHVSSLLLPGNNAFTPVLTAVRSSQSQRLKLILWHLNKT